MFSRSRRDNQSPSEPPIDEAEGQQRGAPPKGRPTPTRREAEQARKQALRGSTDPRAARRENRAREKEAKAANRAALMAGDQKRLPARDQGPVRAYVRDFVDSRFTIAEFFIFIALGVLLLGFVPNQLVQSLISLGWFLLVAIIVVDSVLIMWRLNRQIKARFPEKSERKGAIFYAIMRTLQLRRLRLPPPRVRRGGEPMPPKSASTRKGR
ncbi:MAG: DUF3043 domain-containing protein [Candidatus Nanopelagicales bacterium]